MSMRGIASRSTTETIHLRTPGPFSPSPPISEASGTDAHPRTAAPPQPAAGSSSHTQPTQVELTRGRAEVLQTLIDLYVDEALTLEDLVGQMRNNGFNTFEVTDAMEQAVQRKTQREGKGKKVERNKADDQPRASGSGNPEQDPTGLDAFRTMFAAANDADWAIFTAKARAGMFRPPGITVSGPGNQASTGPGVPAGLPAPTAGFPPSTFPALSPTFLHSLAAASTTAAAVNPHIQETMRVLQACSATDKIDLYVDSLQLVSLDEPLVKSVWKKILQDQYVEFEKLYATLDNPEIDFDDSSREFAAGYVIVKKDHLTSTKRFSSESEWSRLFHAWREGVVLVFPHRIVELEDYRRLIVEIFLSSVSFPDGRQGYSSATVHVATFGFAHATAFDYSCELIFSTSSRVSKPELSVALGCYLRELELGSLLVGWVS
ncbi:hypothetical protein BC835DRAFT_1416340 [Cytidiella melzeri]|nr:hypothetical protein BC835DRAFT_1416340 [Cytidiella melzeri]